MFWAPAPRSYTRKTMLQDYLMGDGVCVPKFDAMPIVQD
jgi:hypothetical protein